MSQVTLATGRAMTIRRLLVCPWFCSFRSERLRWHLDGRQSQFRARLQLWQASDVHVIHSYYWKSSHWSRDIEFHRPSTLIQVHEQPDFSGADDSGNADATAIDACGDKRPQWFLPKPSRATKCGVKTRVAYRVFRDKGDGTLFVCDERL